MLQLWQSKEKNASQTMGPGHQNATESQTVNWMIIIKIPVFDWTARAKCMKLQNLKWRYITSSYKSILKSVTHKKC